MHRIDVGFNRLACAWQSPAGGDASAPDSAAGSPGARFATPTPARSPLPGGPANVTPWPRANQRPELARILVVTSAALPAPVFERNVLHSTRHAAQVYRVECVRVTGVGQLGRIGGAPAARVLVVNIGLIDKADVASLMHLRRRLPGTDWLLEMDSWNSLMLDAAIMTRARGCVDCSIGAEHLTRALDAVLAGELWFPRSMWQSLYLSILDSGASAARSTSVEAALHDRAALTPREAEVLALMRRGMTNKQMAERLHISANTVKKHLAHLFEKRGLHGRRQEFE